MATSLDKVVTQNLECSICFNLFREPKQLNCTHTYCRDCLLSVYESQEDDQVISCPLCRKTTPVKDGDVSNLQTNIPIKSLVDDVRRTKLLKAEQVCTGKSSTEKQRKCDKHPYQEIGFVCVNCRKCICNQCRISIHATWGHRVIEVKDFEKEMKERIQWMEQQANRKIASIRGCLDSAEIDVASLNSLVEQRTEEINNALEDSVKQLKQRRNSLVSEYNDRMQGPISDVEEVAGACRKQIADISSAIEGVRNTLRVPPEEQTLIEYDTRCKALEKMLEEDKPRISTPQHPVDYARELVFHRNKFQNELDLGKLGRVMWAIQKEMQLPSDNVMNCMVAAPGGMIALGYKGAGGVQLFSSDGPRRKVIRDLNVYGLAILSDGSYVVRGDSCSLYIYTQEFMRQPYVWFGTYVDEDNDGGLCVDQENNILVGCLRRNAIQVFIPEGGNAIRVISCGRYEPKQIFAMKTSKMVLVLTRATVRVLDQNGIQRYKVNRPGFHGYPMVCEDNSVLIAWKHDDYDEIDIWKYSNELILMEKLVETYELGHHPNHVWGYLQEFQTGEIAFCSEEVLCIFNKAFLP